MFACFYLPQSTKYSICILIHPKFSPVTKPPANWQNFGCVCLYLCAREFTMINSLITLSSNNLLSSNTTIIQTSPYYESAIILKAISKLFDWSLLKKYRSGDFDCHTSLKSEKLTSKNTKLPGKKLQDC